MSFVGLLHTLLYIITGIINKVSKLYKNSQIIDL
jgi:hypothetical protein